MPVTHWAGCWGCRLRTTRSRQPPTHTFQGDRALGGCGCTHWPPTPSGFRASSSCRPRFQTSTVSQLVNPGLRYLKALFHSALTLRGLPAGVEWLVFEGDSSQRETENKHPRVAFIYLFIYQEPCVSRGGLLGCSL